MEPPRLIPGDSTLIENIVSYLKAKGIFDDFRHECLADVDTKSSCQNLSQRVDGYTSKFLATETWHPDLNKNELRNKLRRHIDESGTLAVGADHVVEQVINPKIRQLFLPKVIEVVHQYIKEQNEILSKKSEIPSTENSSEKAVSDNSVEISSATKTTISDPIADILSFSLSKSKPTISNSSHKNESTQQKHIDISKVEKKKEEKNSAVPVEPSSQKSSAVSLETSSQNLSSTVAADIKADKEKVKKEIKLDESDVSCEIVKKSVKEEVKSEKKKSEDVKVPSSEVISSSEENKVSSSIPIKSNISTKKESEKNKQKSKSASSSKSSSSSTDTKKIKKESSDKHLKLKSSEKLPKDSPSTSKSVSSSKSVSKDEKSKDNVSKSKNSETGSHKTSEASLKKSKPSSSKKESSSSKPKVLPEKMEKTKSSKSIDLKSESYALSQAQSSDKGSKSASHYSSSYDSSQGSDQEKNMRKERQKYFSKHSRKDSSEKQSDKSSKISIEKKKTKNTDHSALKKQKSEKRTNVEKDTQVVIEAAKISSRSNSFGSTSSVSSSSNASKDNIFSTSDEVSDTTKETTKDKKKKQVKEKEQCQAASKILPPPPPPPPPPSSSAISKSSSSAEMSSMEDTMSSSSSDNNDSSSDEESSKETSSDSETDSKSPVLKTLNEKALNPRSRKCNDIYDILLHSSSSEFEGFTDSPERIAVESIHESDISLSSVHTSDLSSFDGELSDEFCSKDVEIMTKRKILCKEELEGSRKSPEKKIMESAYDSDMSVSSVHTSDLSSFNDELSDDEFTKDSESGVKRRLTLKEVQDYFKTDTNALHSEEDKNIKSDNNPICIDKEFLQNSSRLSSDDETSPSGPQRSSRRERKLNPRYASNEYTSIFNCRKETFITKQINPILKSPSSNTSPEVLSKQRQHKSFVETKISENLSKNMQKHVKQTSTEKPRSVKSVIPISESINHRELRDNSSSSDEINAIMDKQRLLQPSDKCSAITGVDALKLQLKQNNSFAIKRKCSLSHETPPDKRPCSRSSVDSSSSEFVTNENKPFNSDKETSHDDKLLKVHSDLTGVSGNIKKDLFCKQRSNNNGDILGKKENLKNSHGKMNNVPEKKTNESEASKELSAL